MNTTITIVVDEKGGAGIFLGGIEEDINGWGRVVTALGQMQLFAQEKMIRLNIEAQSGNGGQPGSEVNGFTGSADQASGDGELPQEG